MCNLYESTPKDLIEPWFEIPQLLGDYDPVIAPLKMAPFVKAEGATRVGVIGQWGMIPHNSKTRIPMTREGRRMSTNNARRETVASAWTYRFAWGRGQRCLIPADSYDEPYWGTGKNIWWRFARTDGQPWALGGIWGDWTDPETGEVVPHFSMLTQNCDGHPLLGLMHKPDPKLPAGQQDKRAVVPIEKEDWDSWLRGSTEVAEKLIRVPGVEMFRHGAADPAKAMALPV
jgi:putative SOS response-associated peptidase YedK